MNLSCKYLIIDKDYHLSLRKYRTGTSLTILIKARCNIEICGFPRQTIWIHATGRLMKIRHLSSVCAGACITLVKMSPQEWMVTVTSQTASGILTNNGLTTTTGTTLTFAGSSSVYAVVELTALTTTTWLITKRIGGWTLG